MWHLVDQGTAGHDFSTTGDLKDFPDHQPQISRIGWYLFAANLISSVVFFFFYPDLIEMHFLSGVLLLIRNVLVVWLMIFLLLPDLPVADQRESLLRIAPRTKKYLIWIPLVLLFAWGTTAAFRPVRNNDIWFLLRMSGSAVLYFWVSPNSAVGRR